jgi:hypothetical protein
VLAARAVEALRKTKPAAIYDAALAASGAYATLPA